jgi:hypothetical protein
MNDEQRAELDRRQRPAYIANRILIVSILAIILLPSHWMGVAALGWVAGLIAIAAFILWTRCTQTSAADP